MQRGITGKLMEKLKRIRKHIQIFHVDIGKDYRRMKTRGNIQKKVVKGIPKSQYVNDFIKYYWTKHSR